MLKAYKYAIFPTEEQQKTLANYFGACRFVYNLGLETKKTAWEMAKKTYSFYDLNKQLTALKRSEAEWLSECPAQSLESSLRHLNEAYQRFFKGGGFPNFKNKDGKQTIEFRRDTKIDFKNKTIWLTRIGNISALFHREFTGEVRTMTLSKTKTNKYFISILVNNHIEIPVKKPVKELSSVGIDLGIKSLAILSDGTIFENQHWFKKSQDRLRVEQRTLSRRKKVKGKNYEKQRLVVAKLHEKIKNQREDYLHKISTSIVKKYDTIVLEDLNIKGMVKNHNLAKAISEMGWHSFTTKLEYKANWQGKNIIRIGRFEPSSKMCSECNAINSNLKLSDREWACESCGVIHDRDINAATNIKNIGLRNKPLNANVEHLARA